MADSSYDNESSILSEDTNNQSRSSQPSYVLVENPTTSDVADVLLDSSNNAYKGLDWSKYPGYAKAPHARRQYTSWRWDYGYRIQHIKSETVYWLCKLCIAKRAHTAALYAITGGSHSQSRQLKDKHSLGTGGNNPEEAPTQFSKYGVDECDDRASSRQ